jgi:glycosyltransferase involved in cell wall biosynthesis
MSPRYLLGPCLPDQAGRWQADRAAGSCLAFNARGDFDLAVTATDSWDDICCRLPANWRPDFVALTVGYTTVPAGLWSASVPLVGLAVDWNLLWHHYRCALRRCDLVLTDVPGVAFLARGGFRTARSANLFGCDPGLLDGPWPDGPRDIDVLFVGNLHPAVQRERLAWLGRLARLGERWKVVIATGVFGEEYRALLGRARVVFNRSLRGECNVRAMEAAAAGALLFQEAENREVHHYLRHLRECVCYRDEDLESRLEHYLSHEEERAALAEAARQRVRDYSFPSLWGRALDTVAAEWHELTCHSVVRVSSPQSLSQVGPEADAEEALYGRTWQALSATDRGDFLLAGDLGQALGARPQSAPLNNALGMARALAGAKSGEIVCHFRRAIEADPLHLVAALNLADVLTDTGDRAAAADVARKALTALDRVEVLPPAVLDAPSHPPGFSVLRVEWERAAWENAGRPTAEARAKHDLLRWRAHALLAELTGDLAHHREAALARPDLPATRAALGCALGRAGQPAEAVPHLRRALTANPFDRPAARGLYQALGEAGDRDGQQALAADRRLLSRAAPGVVPPEPWFVEPATHDTSVPIEGSKAARLCHVNWEGVQDEMQSLALVNRQLCLRLIERGHDVSLLPLGFPPELGVPRLPLPVALTARLRVPLSRPCEVHVRHAWPPDFRPPPAGHWVLMQPWEFGSLPRAWVGPIVEQVDEVWAYTRAVRDCYVVSGVPADRVQVVPLGVDLDSFRPGVPLLPLKTRRTFKFLFVGGTIPRKGFDVLMAAYARAFTAEDDVCLVVKDMGAGSFYRGQTAEADVARLQATPSAPEVEYIDRPLYEEELAGLYAACQCLVAPYRGEGFGLPTAEAMVCGLPVVVTGLGAALDFCDESRAYLIPSKKRCLPEQRVGEWETVGRPWLAEPDGEALVGILRHVVAHPDEAWAKGSAGSAYIRANFTWEQSANAVERRLEALRDRPIRRTNIQPAPLSNGPIGNPSHGRPMRVSLTMIVKNEEANLPDCLTSVADLVDEIIIVDTGSTDRTKEIAARYGARVFDFAWVDSFATARNESLRHATGDYVLWMDADDRLDDENRIRLRTLLAGLTDSTVAFVMKCLCLPDKETNTATAVDHVRLFRNRPGVTWEFRVHEQVLPSLRRLGADVRWSDVIVRHVGYQDPDLRRRKLERDLRLLGLEGAEKPDHPFVLFNLGSIAQELGQTDEAVTLLQRSLALSQPGDSIVRKLYALLAQCHRRLGQGDLALAACRKGREFYADDVELLFQEGLARRERGDRIGARACWAELLRSRATDHFASLDTGLCGYKTRHNLAHLALEDGDLAEAEAHWRAALAERPNFMEAWQGLQEVELRRSGTAT